jgi:phage terminase large subunit
MGVPPLTEAIAYYFDHPYEFVVDIVGVTPTPQQSAVLQALPHHKTIAVKSGHGIGKTSLESWIIMWFMFTRPYCKIPCTAPTQHQLYDVLWSELSKWIGKSKIAGFFEWTQTHVYNKQDPHNWFAVARSSNKAENMQGFHADELLFIIDEGSGVPQDMMEVIEGALTNEGAYCFMAGNPTQLSGTFYNAFHKDKAHWTTFSFSCLDSPLVTPAYVARMTAKYGAGSDIYKVRVLGEFPDVADDTIVKFSDVEQAIVNQATPDPSEPVHLGIDVARYGNDKTVIVVRQGLSVLKLSTYAKKSTMETVGYAMLELKAHPRASSCHVWVDDSGVGGGVTDRLRELTDDDPRIFITGVNNGASSSKPEDYANLGAELWYNMAQSISGWDIPDDEELVGQLTTRKYFMTSRGQIALEPKDAMKTRGLDSPDKADALSLAFCRETKVSSVVVDL